MLQSPDKAKFEDELSWLQAQAYASQIGRMPNFFSAAVRLLVADHQKNERALRPVTKYLVSQALRGKKILSMLYYATLQLKPKELEGRKNIRLGELINLYEPYDIAVLYGIYLIYRRALKALDLDHARIRKILPHLQEEVQLGGIIGAAIPRIGIGNGVLAGTLHQLAILMISGKCPTAVAEYHQQLHKQHKRIDLQNEVERFGCTSLQVGAVLLTKIGFPRSFIETYLGALDPELGMGDTTGMLHQIRYGKLWINGLVEKKDQPTDVIPGDYYPLLEANNWMLDEAANIEMGNTAWIERDGTDISEELTPLLYNSDTDSKPVPEKLRDIFSLKEISEMDEDEFDDLIDEIDKEIAEGTLDEHLSEEAAPQED
jgi:hypothetical protein